MSAYFKKKRVNDFFKSFEIKSAIKTIFRLFFSVPSQTGRMIGGTTSEISNPDVCAVFNKKEVTR